MRPTGASASRPASGGVFTTAARLRDETLDACPSASPDVGPVGCPIRPPRSRRAPPRGSPPPARASAPRARRPLARPPRRARRSHPVPPREPPRPAATAPAPSTSGPKTRKPPGAPRRRRSAPPPNAKNEPAKPPARGPSSPPWPPPPTPPATRTPAPPSPTPSLTKSSNASSRWSPRRASETRERVPRGATPSTMHVHPIREDGPRRARRHARRRVAVATWMNERGVTTPSGLIAFLAGGSSRGRRRLLRSARRSRLSRSRARPRLRNRARDGGGTRVGKDRFLTRTTTRARRSSARPARV